LPALDEDASNVFSKSERLLLDHAAKRFKSASELKELIQEVLHHPDFDLDSVDHDLHERLMKAVEDGDIEIIDMWEEGDGDQDVTFVKRKLENIMRELMADERMAGHQHYGFKLQANPNGERIFACEANGSVAFQLAQLSMGPDTVPMALVAYIDGTFMRRGIGIRHINPPFTVSTNMISYEIPLYDIILVV
jgi:hypothetical protein